MHSLARPQCVCDSLSREGAEDINIISLFSGAGGLDLGFELEGFRPVIAYDKKSAAIATYNHNRSQDVARLADLSLITGADIIHDIDALNLVSIPVGVVGGPPCQYFSNGNRTPRSQDDPRRILPVRYAEILRDLNEAYELHFFILENVAGLITPAHRHDFDTIVAMFEAAGFSVSYAVLDAYGFGVAQNRARVFLAGWNAALYPEDQYRFPVSEPSGLTVRDAIEGLAEPCYWAADLDPATFPEHPNHWTMRPISDKFRNPPPPALRPYTRSFRRLAWDKPSYTVAYGHNEIHVHPNGHRRLSIYEAMLLQGFPRQRAGYHLLGNLTEQVTLVSDAVPPPMAAALARSIKGFLSDHTAR